MDLCQLSQLDGASTLAQHLPMLDNPIRRFLFWSHNLSSTELMNTAKVAGGQFTYLLLFISDCLFTSFEMNHDAPSRRWLCTLPKGADLNNSKPLRPDLIPNPTLINPVVPFLAFLHFLCDGVKQGQIEAFKCKCWQANLSKSTLRCFHYSAEVRVVFLSFRLFPLILQVRM